MRRFPRIVQISLFGLALLGLFSSAPASALDSSAPAATVDTAEPAATSAETTTVPAPEARVDAAPAVDSCPDAASAEPRPAGWDPATCGTCGEFCTSDNACHGRLLGDVCGHNGLTCKARTGCALFNCCFCG